MVLSPFNSTLDSLTHAVIERAKLVKAPTGEFTRPPQPTPEANFSAFIAAHAVVAQPSVPLTTSEFIASRPGRKKRLYKSVVEQTRGNRLGDEYLRKLAVTQFFIKVEKTHQQATNLFTRETSKCPVPRLINPRAPLYNLALGKYTVAIEHTVYDDIAKLFGRPCIAKGMNYVERAATIVGHFEDFQDPVWKGGDASRFDQHTSALPLRMEHSVIKAYFPGDRWLAQLLKLQLDNRGYGFTQDGFISASLGAMRMSGDMNTALGNCIISAALIWTRAKELGIRVHCLIDGDDFGVVMERADIAKWERGASEWYLRYGYNIKWEDTVDIIEKVEFCQTHPIWVPQTEDNPVGYVMCRNPHKVVNSDLCGYSQCSNDKYYLALVSAIGQAGCTLASGMPILDSFYHMAERLGKPNPKQHLVEFQKYWYGQYLRGIKRVERAVHPDTRLSFELAYGYPPHVQEQLEAAFELIVGIDLDKTGFYHSSIFDTQVPLPYYA